MYCFKYDYHSYFCIYLGRQVYEDEDKYEDIDNIDLVCDNEEADPIMDNEHLNNPLIKIDLKVKMFYYFIIYLKYLH